jgi:hypothetical protein
VIRQAISCDICATEKKQTNHWFVAYEQGAELRVSGWQSRNRLRPGSKHLCGQTCLHKLVDDFMARAIAVRPQAAAADVADVQEDAMCAAACVPSNVAEVEAESSARMLTPPAPPVPPTPLRPPAELVTMPGRPHIGAFPSPHDDSPRYASRNWRAEAWARERERELRANESRPDIARRRSTA